MSALRDVGLAVAALYAAVLLCAAYLAVCIRLAARAERRAMARLVATTPITRTRNPRKGDTT